MSEMHIVWSTVISIVWVVNIILMSAVIWVAICIELCGKWEEDSVPCFIFSILSIFLISVSLIISLEDNSLTICQLFLWNHSGEWFQIWSRVPIIMDEMTSCSHVSKEHTTGCASHNESWSEHFSSVRCGIQVDEIMLESVHWHRRDSTILSLCTSSHIHTNWPCKEETNSKVLHKTCLVSILLLSLILPWPSLWTCSVFSESMGDPWIWFEFSFEPKVKS